MRRLWSRSRSRARRFVCSCPPDLFHGLDRSSRQRSGHPEAVWSATCGGHDARYIHFKEVEMANRSDRDLSTGAARSGASDWGTEELYWRDNWSTRPYASADRSFEYYRPAYQYGVESATRYRGREWNDVENDLRSGWDRFEGRSQNTWEDGKDAS